MKNKAGINARKRKVEKPLVNLTNVSSNKNQKAITDDKPQIRDETTILAPQSCNQVLNYPLVNTSHAQPTRGERQVIDQPHGIESTDGEEDDFDDIENLQDYVLSDDDGSSGNESYGGFDNFDDEDDEDLEIEPETFQTTLPGGAKNGFTFKVCFTREFKNKDFRRWMQPIVVTCTHKGAVIGRADGASISRRPIRKDFWREINKPNRVTSHLGFDLFDRYGCLKSVWKDHVVRKGTGVWGDELNCGILLLIIGISVDFTWQRRGVGRILASTLIRKAESMKYGLAFSLVAPGSINSFVDEESNGRSHSEMIAIREKHWKAADAFFRSIGFRRIGSSPFFGLATDQNHAAHSITPANDFDPEELDRVQVSEYDDIPYRRGNLRCAELFRQMKAKRYSLHQKLFDLPDAKCFAFLNDQKTQGFNDWHVLDNRHDNLLHVLALTHKHHSVKWVLDNIDQDGALRKGRNVLGDTPLEALQETLEKKRSIIKRPSGKVFIMDEFLGFDRDAVACLALLRGMEDPTELEALQLKYGCTCGACISGLLSPRQKHSLLFQAEITGDLTALDVEDAEWWLTTNSSQISHVAPDILAKFRTNKSFRQGFANVFKLIADRLRHKQLPTTANIIAHSGGDREWLPATLNFLDREAIVVSALRVVFEVAMEQDKMAGNGLFFDVPELEQDWQKLPQCRNDHEFGFVALACGVTGVGRTG